MATNLVSGASQNDSALTVGGVSQVTGTEGSSQIVSASGSGTSTGSSQNTVSNAAVDAVTGSSQNADTLTAVQAGDVVEGASQSTSGTVNSVGVTGSSQNATLGTTEANEGDQSITGSSQAALTGGAQNVEDMTIQGNLQTIVTGTDNKHYVPAMIDDIEFDVLISVETKYTADAPEYAMEDGAYTSDSILKKPMELTAVMLIAEKPVTFAGRHAGRTVAEVRDALEDKYFAGELVTFTTAAAVYENMAITSLSLPQNDYLDAMQVSVTLKYVNVTNAEMSEYDYDGASDSADSTSTTESDAALTDLVA